MRLKTFMTFDENRQVAKKILNKSFRSRFVSHHFLTMALLLHFKFLTTICSKKPQNIIYSLSNFFDTEGEKGKFWGILFFLRLLLILDFALFGFAFVERVCQKA